MTHLDLEAIDHDGAVHDALAGADGSPAPARSGRRSPASHLGATFYTEAIAKGGLKGDSRVRP